MLAVHRDVKLDRLLFSCLIDWPERCLAINCVWGIGAIVFSTSNDWRVDEVSIDDNRCFRRLKSTFEVTVLNKVLEIPWVEFHIDKEFVRNVGRSLTLVRGQIENWVLEIMEHNSVVSKLVIVN